MRKTVQIALIAVLIVMNFGAVAVHAQTQAGKTGEKAKYASLPPHIRDALIQEDMRREPIRRNKIDRKPVPWRGPDGEQLVGIVENRMLTKPQLTLRTNLILQGLPPERDPIAAEDRRVLLEDKLLAEWLIIATLAQHAETTGHQVSEAEVRRAINELNNAATLEGDGNSQVDLRFVGIPESELFNEIRDSLLVEKLVQKRIRETITEDKMQKIFEARPQNFLEPTRVSGYHIFLPKQRNMLRTEEKQLLKDMGKFRNQLRKAKNEKHYTELETDIVNSKFTFSVMNNVTSEDPMNYHLKEVLFTETKPGNTSEVFESQIGYHVVKVVSRQEGDAMTLANARGMIEAELFEHYRDFLYSGVKGNYSIHSAGSGLNKWVPVAPYPEPVAPQIQPSSARDQAIARKLRQSGYDFEPPPLEDVLIHNAEKRLNQAGESASSTQ